MNKIWLIADTHFSHKNIISYCNRPFTSTEEMDKEMIKKWNKKVRRDDLVFVLGDFALCGKDKIIEIGKQLNGKKVLILGNHDGASIKTYYEAGFELVSKYPIVFDNFCILSHYPAFTNSNNPYVNIFGHVHDDPNYTSFSRCGACVSAERIGYEPVDYELVKKRIIECQNEFEGEINNA